MFSNTKKQDMYINLVRTDSNPKAWVKSEYWEFSSLSTVEVCVFYLTLRVLVPTNHQENQECEAHWM